jgi:hypothetical protein
MDIQLTSQISLWFDGENYGYLVLFEDEQIDPPDNLSEGYKPTLEGAITAIATVIKYNLQQQSDRS